MQMKFHLIAPQTPKLHAMSTFNPNIGLGKHFTGNALKFGE